MAIRLPVQTVLDQTNVDTGAASLIGGYAYPFKLPQDTDNCVMVFTPSITGAGISATFQTSYDGGSTYYDVARTSTASASPSGVGPQFVSIPLIAAANTRASVVAAGSVIAVNTIGTAAASTLGSGQFSGLPIMGLQNRVFVIITGNSSAHAGSRIQVMVNSQSASAN